MLVISLYLGIFLLVTKSKSSLRDIKAVTQTHHKHHAAGRLGLDLQALRPGKG